MAETNKIKLKKFSIVTPLQIKMSAEELADWATFEPLAGHSYADNARLTRCFADEKGMVTTNFCELTYLINKGIKPIDRVGDIYIHADGLKKFDVDTPLKVKMHEDEIKNWAQIDALKPLKWQDSKENYAALCAALDQEGYLTTDVRKLTTLLRKGVKQIDQVGAMYLDQNSLRAVENTELGR